MNVDCIKKLISSCGRKYTIFDNEIGTTVLYDNRRSYVVGRCVELDVPNRAAIATGTQETGVRSCVVSNRSHGIAYAQTNDGNSVLVKVESARRGGLGMVRSANDNVPVVCGTMNQSKFYGYISVSPINSSSSASCGVVNVKHIASRLAGKR